MPRRCGGRILSDRRDLVNLLALFHAYTAVHMPSRAIVKETSPPDSYSQGGPLNMTAPNGNNYGGYNQQPPQYNQQYYSQPQQSGGVGGATIAAIIAAIVAVIAVAAMVIMFVTIPRMMHRLARPPIVNSSRLMPIAAPAPVLASTPVPRPRTMLRMRVKIPARSR